MSSSPDENRFAPPTAHVEDVQVATGTLATRGSRFGAALIDGLIMSVAYYGLAYTVLKPLIPDPVTPDPSAGAIILQLAITLVLLVLLQGYLLAKHGQTIGKRLVGLRIVRSDGERATFGRLMGLRYVLNNAFVFIPFVGLIYALVDSLMIYRASHKCLHDNLADTIVVKV